MNPALPFLLATTIFLSATATAGDRHHRAGDRHDYRRHQHHQHHHKHENRDLIVGAIVLGGLAVATSSYSPPPVTTTYIQPVQPLAPLPRPQIYYYCASAQMYYPAIGYCSEGWLRISPPY